MLRENSAKDWRGQWLCHGPCSHARIRRPQERESDPPGPQEDQSLRATLSPLLTPTTAVTAPWVLGSTGLSGLPGRAAEHKAVQQWAVQQWGSHSRQALESHWHPFQVWDKDPGKLATSAIAPVTVCIGMNCLDVKGVGVRGEEDKKERT